jgi:hypothetical protein
MSAPVCNCGVSTPLKSAGLHYMLLDSADTIGDRAGWMHIGINLIFDLAMDLGERSDTSPTCDELLYLAADLRSRLKEIEARAVKVVADIAPLNPDAPPVEASAETSDGSPREQFSTILERGYDIQSAAALLLLLSKSDTADNVEVPMPLKELFVQAGYLARQIEAHAASITEIADPASLGIVEA